MMSTWRSWAIRHVRVIGLSVIAAGAAMLLLLAIASDFADSARHGADRSIVQALAAKLARRGDLVVLAAIACVILGLAMLVAPAIQRNWRQAAARWGLAAFSVGAVLAVAGIVNLIGPGRVFPSQLTCTASSDTLLCEQVTWWAAPWALVLGLAAMLGGMWVGHRTDPPEQKALTRRRHLRTFLTVSILGPVMIVVAALYHPGAIFCDGAYPVWAGDPCGGTWTNPSLLDYFWPPEHWFAPTGGGLMQDLRR
jgi:hypothetical protein